MKKYSWNKQLIVIAIVITLLSTSCREKSDNSSFEPDSANELNIHTEKTETTKQIRYVTVKVGLRLRTEPSTESKPLRTIPYAEAVTVNDSFPRHSETINGIPGDWYEISYNATTGFAFNGLKSDRKFNNGNGFLAYVPPEAKIHWAGDCSDRNNFILESDSYYASLVLLDDKTFYEIASNSGDGEHYIYGKYTQKDNQYNLNARDLNRIMYKMGDRLVDDKAYALLNKNPKIFTEWKKNPLPADADSSKLISVWVCE